MSRSDIGGAASFLCSSKPDILISKDSSERNFLMPYIVVASALLAAPETIVKASSLEEAFKTDAEPELPAAPLPFSLEGVEWSFMDAVESEAYRGEGEYVLVPYASVNVYLDNNGNCYASEEEVETAAEKFLETGHEELELPGAWVEAGFELSHWDDVFVQEDNQ